MKNFVSILLTLSLLTLSPGIVINGPTRGVTAGGGPAYVTGLDEGLGINGGTTASITTSNGDLIVVGINDYQAVAASTLSDSKSVSWTLLDTVEVSGLSRVRMYWGVAGSSGGHTFTLTGTDCYGAISVRVFSGLTTSDQIAAGATGSGTVQPGSITPSTTDTFAVQCVGFTTTSSTSINESYTAAGVDYSDGDHFGLFMAYKSFPTASATNPTWTLSGSAAAAGANFKP